MIAAALGIAARTVMHHTTVAFESSPPRRLTGDRGPMALAVDLDVRGERGDDITGATAGVRVRFGLGRATAIGLGYAAGLDLRAGALDGGVDEADAYPVGLALRASGGAGLTLLAGAGVGGIRGAGATGIDETTATVGVRLGADRRCWSTVAAGAGPFVAVTYRDLAGAELYGISLGGSLWGGNEGRWMRAPAPWQILDGLSSRRTTPRSCAKPVPSGGRFRLLSRERGSSGLV